jgi:hypothetical protein
MFCIKFNFKRDKISQEEYQEFHLKELDDGWLLVEDVDVVVTDVVTYGSDEYEIIDCDATED